MVASFPSARCVARDGWLRPSPLRQLGSVWVCLHPSASILPFPPQWIHTVSTKYRHEANVYAFMLNTGLAGTVLGKVKSIRFSVSRNSSDNYSGLDLLLCLPAAR